MEQFSRSFIVWVWLIVAVGSVWGEDLLCYSCFSLNYRSQVAPRNTPLPPPQNRKNLSDVVSSLRRLGKVPPLSDGCADVSLNSQPSFLSVPRTICRGRESTCAKITYLLKGERIVVRDCFSHLFPDRPHLPLPGTCLEDYNRYRSLANATICSCSHHLCNDSPRLSLLPLLLLLIGFICS